MKNIKIIAVIILVSIGMTLFSACEETKEQSEDFLVVTSFYPMYVFTKNITEGAEGVRVINITEPQTGCLHDYQLIPENIKLLERANVFVINGGGMEAFMEKVYENINDINVLTASDGIEFISTDCNEHHDHKHEEIYNSHVWTYIPNAVKEIENIRDGLSDLNPANEKIYRENAEKYIEDLTEIHEKFESFKNSFKNVKMVVTHEAFDYMAEGYGFEIVGKIMSDHNMQPSAGELSNLAEKIKREGVIGIFKEPQYPDGVIKTLAKETKVPVFELDPMVTGDDAHIGIYESIMLNNLKTIENALKK